MRVTFVLAGFDWSGGQRVLAAYSQGLLKLGHDVLVVAWPPVKPGLKRSLLSLVRGQGWPNAVRKGRAHFTDSAVPSRILARKWPVDDAALPDADVVIATWWETAEWVQKLSPAKGVKAYFVQGHEVVLFGEEYQSTIARIEATYRLPLNYLAVSRWLEELLRNRYGRDRVQFVSNGVDLGRFHAPPRGKQAAPTIGFVYSPVAMKGAADYAEAIRLARLQLPGLKVRAFGLDLPGATGLPPDTTYLRAPPQESIPGIYASCDAWLLASRGEGFGLPLLEAMACRTPFIAMNTGAAPELAQDGGGFVVQPGDTAAMAEHIVRVCSLSDQDWRAISDAAHATAQRFGWDDQIKLFEQALLRMCS